MEDKIRKAIARLKKGEAKRLKHLGACKSNPDIFPEFRYCTPDDYERFESDIREDVKKQIELVESAGREKIKKRTQGRKRKRCRRGGSAEESDEWSEHSEGEESGTSSLDVYAQVEKEEVEEEVIDLCDDDDDDDDDDDSGNDGESHKATKGETSEQSTENNSVQAEVDDDEDDTNGEIRKEHVSKMEKEKNRLMMAIQGFRGEPIQRSNAIGEEPTSPQITPKTPLDLLTTSYNGRVFRKNHCYIMAPNVTEQEIMVGIRSFVDDETARCVLIVKFEDTILGIDDEGGSGYQAANFNHPTHVQVYKHVQDMHLSKLARESDVETIPSLIYEPQTAGKWTNFGYFYDPDDTKRIRRRQNGIRCLEVFAGAGGSLRGYHEQGIKTIIAIERDKCGCDTLRENYGENLNVYEGCVEKFIQSFDALKPTLGRIDMVQYSSPCQGFSGANRNITPSAKDLENNRLSYRLLDLLRLTRCPALVFENVLGIWRRKNVQYIKNITKELLNMGYQVRCMTLHACDYGDPQKRPRFFMFIMKKGYPVPSPPTPTHGPKGNDMELLPYVTVREAIGHLKNNDETYPNMEGKQSNITPGEHGVIRLEADDIAPAIRSSSTPHYHYEEDRPITVREAAYLQSFPPEYKFCGNLCDQYRQVGNAVPVGMATAVARSMKDVLTYEYEEM